VIGGLAAATLTTLTVLPAVFAVVQGRSSARSVSLDPDDPESTYYEPAAGARDGKNGDGMPRGGETIIQGHAT
jgi:hypothetical protein